MSRTKITDHSNDRQYFAITPHLVWALCQDPFELTLWYTIKMLTFEGQTCRLTTPVLAQLAMMSLDKVHNCRRRLIDIGLLTGEIRPTDSAHPQPIWHLAIPDLWSANIQWSLENNSIAKKLVYKTSQRRQFKHDRRALRELKHLQHRNNNPPNANSLAANALKNGKENAPIPPTDRFSSDENRSLSSENWSPSDENASLPGENSLYIEEPSNTLNNIFPKNRAPTTNRMDHLLDDFTEQQQPQTDSPIYDGGGGKPSLVILSNPFLETLRATNNNSNTNNDDPTRANKILAMQTYAINIINQLPHQWADFQKYVQQLPPPLLATLCRWLCAWELPSLQSSNFNTYIDDYYRQQRYEELYSPYWSDARNIPGLIKSRIVTMLEPLAPQDDQELWDHIATIARELQEQSSS